MAAVGETARLVTWGVFLSFHTFMFSTFTTTRSVDTIGMILLFTHDSLTAIPLYFALYLPITKAPL